MRSFLGSFGFLFEIFGGIFCDLFGILFGGLIETQGRLGEAWDFRGPGFAWRLGAAGDPVSA